MARTFAITTTATNTLKADNKGHAEAVFTVSNTSARPVRCQAKAKALDNTKQDWLKLSGESERNFAPGSTQQFVITFDGVVPTVAPASAPKAPAASPGSGAQPGATAAVAPAPIRYGFRLDVAAAANPEEDFIEGPVVTVEIPPKIIVPPSRWWIIPVIAVVLIAIGVGLWFVLRNKSVPVPNVVGKQFEEAKAAIEDAKLVAVKKEVQLTQNVPAGQVLDQDPKPGGDKVKTGTEINLTVEGAKPMVRVPDVVKRFVDDAKQRIAEAGLTAVETGTAVVEGLQAKQVASQNPGPGAELETGKTVELVVASPTLIKVPDVRFKPLAIAKQEIAAKGLQAVEKEPELADASVAPGNVKSQKPEKDAEVPPNSPVELVIAAVPKPVPQLVGRKIAEAQLLLQQQGLKMGTVWGTYNENNASTVSITGQTPTAGTQVAQGSNVNVSVPCIGMGCRIIIFDRVNTIKVLPTTIQPFEMKRQP